VNKISLARGLACEALQLAAKSTAEDSKVDAICLKLGRTSAILRRTQGQLPGHTATPVPPTEWKQRAIEIEGFCGVGSDTTVPRGLLNPDYVQAVDGLRAYLQARVAEESTWISEQRDPAASQCPAPTELKPQDVADCLN
jgi:hypothetical protein